jgi:hypothetical protein
MQIPNVKSGEDESNLSSGSKNSDKENSQLRMNMAATKNQQMAKQSASVTPAMKNNAKSKLGLSEQQIKNIRQAPKFKGMASVL